MCPNPAGDRGHVGLSLCMIVRDEAENLARCLQSVRGLVQESIVVDTGSQDATIAIARQHGAVVVHHAWTDDFAAARNIGLQRATGEWILVLDADEELTPASRSLLSGLLADEQVTGYICRIENLLTPGDPPTVECSAALRLFRNHPGYRFAGALHEQIAPAIQAATPDAVFAAAPLCIRHHGYLASVMQARQKSRRNRKIAERMAAEHPEDASALGNLAIEHSLAGEWAEAAARFRQAAGHATPGMPWHAQMSKHLALALCHQEAWEAAAAVLADALPLYPRYTDLLYLYGLSLARQGDLGAARAALAQCLLAGPAPCPPYTSVDPAAGGEKARLALHLLGQGLSNS